MAQAGWIETGDSGIEYHATTRCIRLRPDLAEPVVFDGVRWRQEGLRGVRRRETIMDVLGLDDAGLRQVEARRAFFAALHERMLAAVRAEVARDLSLAEQRQRRAAQGRVACVYVLRDSRGRHKVGYTVNLKHRLVNLGGGAGERLVEVSAYEFPNRRTARFVETYAHRKLAAYRQTGEWFTAPLDEITAAIQEAQQQRDVTFLAMSAPASTDD